MKILITTLFLVVGGMGFADEPAWTSVQRAEHSQAVVDARVVKIEKLREQSTKSIHLMRAVLQVAKIQKGKELVGDAATIEILYETSPLGAGHRCPSFPVLTLEQRGLFYLRFNSGLSEQKAWVLEMGSDVERFPLDSRVVIPALMKALDGTPTFEDLSRILGEPPLDVGSGIHIFVYVFDQGGAVSVATPDRKKVLYVDRSGERLYPIKD